MEPKIVYGSHVILSADEVIERGAVYIKDGRVADTGVYADLKDKYGPVQELGSDQHIVLPGFVNSHNHGKGVTDFQRGQIDNTLETWKFRSYPPIETRLDTTWAAIKQLEAGVTTTMHNHDVAAPERYQSEFEAVIEAYRSAKLKVAFAPSVANQNHFVYGDNESFIASLPDELQSTCRDRISRSRAFGPVEYMDAVARLCSKYQHDSNVRIMHGPIAPQWVAEDTLRAIRKDADERKLPIHIHVQQTKLQNLYGYKQYGKSLIAYLDSIGFLRGSVTIGHAVWISQQDIEILAATGANTTHHPACNLRVRNGISPVYALLQAGVRVGLGLDDKEFGDDKDFLEEMRLASKLHRVTDHRLDSPHLSPREVFRMATEYGAETLDWSAEIGTLKEGGRADMVLLNTARLSEPFVSPTQSPIDLVLYRGGTRDLDMVIVDGEVVVEQGKVVHIDRQEVIRQIREQMPDDYVGEFEARNSDLQALRPYIAAWFSDWYDEMGDFEGRPFYHMNNR